LNHLFAIKVPKIIIGYWEPGKNYLLDQSQEKKVFIIDEIGQFVWKLCDGSHSVRKIEQLLVQEADQSQESVRTSLATFLIKLKKKGYITFEQRSR